MRSILAFPLLICLITVCAGCGDDRADRGEAAAHDRAAKAAAGASPAPCCGAP